MQRIFNHQQLWGSWLQNYTVALHVHTLFLNTATSLQRLGAHNGQVKGGHPADFFIKSKPPLAKAACDIK
jgi:hypothetical protein